MAEWLKAPDSKSGIGATLSVVRIHPLPQDRDSILINGEVAEWFKATVLKTVVRQRTVSSNLTLSAEIEGMKLRLTFLVVIIFMFSVALAGVLRLSPSALYSLLITNADDLLNGINKQNTVDRYRPSDLVELTDLGYKGQFIRSIVYPDLKRLFEDAKSQGLYLRIVSAYRSYDQQKSLFSGYLKKDKNANRYSAEAGHSEHQLGTTIDFGSGEGSDDLAVRFADTREGVWLEAHSPEYGFVMSYPKNQESKTGYIFEPWHFRYVGVDSALQLQHKQLTLKEFIDENDSVTEKRQSSPATVLAAKIPSPTQARLVREPGGSNIYYINDQGYRHLIPSPEIFLSYGNKWQEVRAITHSELISFPETFYISTAENAGIYKLENGAKRLVISTPSPTPYISRVNSTEFNYYPTGPDLK